MWNYQQKSHLITKGTEALYIYILYLFPHTNDVHKTRYFGGVRGKLSFYDADRRTFTLRLPIYCTGSLFRHLVAMVTFIHICTVKWLFCASIYINNCPTRCNTKQSIYYFASSLYMFRVSTTPIIRSTQNCNYSPRYFTAASLQRSQVGHVGGN